MRILLLGLVVILGFACQPNQKTDLEKENLGFQIPDDVNLELVAKEPLINAPVAIDFDEQGRIWVVEMTSYMPNIEGTEEESNNNHIKILEDQDQDGYYETVKVFLDKLTLPRSILHAYGGLIYSEPPNLWYVEIQNDKPGKKTLIDDSYATDGNVEHKPSALTLNLDNWIYSSGSNVRYKKQNDQWIKEFTTPRGQWGMTKDNYGRLVYNNNSTLIAADEVIPNALFKNEFLKLNKNICQIITQDQKVFPLQATAVNRGYQDGVLDENEFLINTTSACSPEYFRNENSIGWNNAAFVCLPEINAVKKLDLSDNGMQRTAVHSNNNSEYLITKDEGFRPVDLKFGPDNKLYIVDMHRGIIQHKAYMTSYLREKILDRKLDTIYQMGRLLRLSPNDNSSNSLVFSISEDPLGMLYSDNAFLRDKAQHYIVYKNKKEFIPQLKAKLKSEDSEINLLHTLWTLEGLGAITESELIPLIEKDMLQLSYQSLYLLTQINVKDKESLKTVINNLFQKENSEFDLSLAHFANGLQVFSKEELLELYVVILERNKNKERIIEGIIADNQSHQKYLLQKLTAKKDSSYHTINEALSSAEKRRLENNSVYYYKENLNLEDRRTIGMKLYRTYCATCHGIDGEGIDRLAPRLIDSDYVSGEEDKLILITLHGMSGPIKLDGKLHHFSGEMTGLNDNKDLSDKDIKDILHFVRNAFTSAPYSIEEKRIKELREIKPEDGGTYTESSLDSTLQIINQVSH